MIEGMLTEDAGTEGVVEAVGAVGAVAGLAARGVVAVALTWVDNAGLTRVKGVPLGRLSRAVTHGVGASPSFDTFLVDDSSIVARYAGGPVGDLRLRPDLSRLTQLRAQPGWAWAPADRYALTGHPHPQDARAFARAQAEGLRRRGLHALAGFEIEWMVSPAGSDDFTAACSGPAYGMVRVVELSDYLRDLVEALTAQGIELLQIHPEYAAGQFEVSVAPEDPVAAADTSVLVRQTVRGVAARHGLRVSFAPQALAGSVGNGGHLHLSLHGGVSLPNGVPNGVPNGGPGGGPGGGPLMAGGSGLFGLTAAGEAFVAGVLRHLPALMALGAPSVTSYLRLVPSNWAGAYACWGLENREAAIRMITGAAGEPGGANIEVKCFDLAANPYLLIGGVLAAGIDGLAAAATLPEPFDGDPASCAGVELARLGVRRLPTDLGEAVAAFGADEVLRTALGVELHDTIGAVRRGEIELFAGLDPSAVVDRVRWRY
ncbi:type I glutamate--ammonia ligase [Parafrankia elaeagni]|uniref:glutamine synthetase family protein n=1 Tax=Parafrankia elaeagni TaxID=222534 RepID=UPI0003825062|nr:glutamine synthetase family protein [Parafrankia elaeagni]